VAQWLTLKAVEVIERLCDTSNGTFGPDGKVQVAYDGRAIKSFVVSVRCNEGTEEQLEVAIRDALQNDTALAFYGAESAKLTVNPPNGKFYTGGPMGDCGLTGRKISVDSYCGLVPHGGGAFSGKDLTKVDRTGAYLARAAAKLLVSSGVARSATVGLSWQMGADRPNDILVTTDGDQRIANAMVLDFVMEHPLAYWVKKFYSEIPILWSELAQGCHFRDPQLPWEKR
jgi:S-adenosylmethionine synthetase